MSGELPVDEPPLLSVADLHAWYPGTDVIQGISLIARSREVVALLGANGSGKSTVLRCIAGLHRQCRGTIEFRGEPTLGRQPWEVARLGMGYLPQDGRGFMYRTVKENLELAAAMLHRRQVGAAIDDVLQLLPSVGNRLTRPLGDLSGGERMLAGIAMAVVSPRVNVLLLDEPLAGLAPSMADEVVARLDEVRDARGVGIVVVEQNVSRCLAWCDRALVLRLGRIGVELGQSDVVDLDVRLLWEHF